MGVPTYMREELGIFLNHRVYIRGEGGRGQSLYGKRAWNFSKSQSLYGSVRSNISTYFFIFLHIFDIYFFISTCFMSLLRPPRKFLPGGKSGFCGSPPPPSLVDGTWKNSELWPYYRFWDMNKYKGNMKK